MKIRIHLFVLCFVVTSVFLFFTASAQDMASAIKNSTPEQRAQMMTIMMKTKLQLDTAQTTKVKAINLKYGQKTTDLMKDDGGKFAKFRKMKAVQKDKDAELKTVLTADQFKQYQTMEEEMKEKMKEKMQERKQ